MNKWTLNTRKIEKFSIKKCYFPAHASSSIELVSSFFTILSCSVLISYIFIYEEESGDIQNSREKCKINVC